MDRIVGRTAVVTGAGNGLGRDISLRLAQAGARVILVGRHHETLESVAAEIVVGPGSARVQLCDTSDTASVSLLSKSLVDEEVSILVNNAGVPGPVAPLVDIRPAEWDAVFAVNVRGVYLLCAAFIPPMVKRGFGDVINIASVTGKRPLANRTPYASSKMAVLGLTATLAYEVGPLGVNVNSLSPGPVQGPRMERIFRLAAERAGTTVDVAENDLVSRAALQRMVKGSEVADALVAMLHMPGLCAADIDLSAGMVAR